MTYDPKIPEVPLSLCKEFAEGRVVLFIGAGVSMAVNAPGWEGLVASLFLEHGVNAERFNLSLEQKVSLFVNRYGRFDLNKSLDEVLRKSRSLSIHEDIVRLPASLILTTNYDPHLREAAERLNLSCNVICQDREVPRKFLTHDRTIVHLYGTTDEPLASEEDLISFERDHPALSLVLQHVLLTRTVLFLGFSFRDFNVLNHILRVRAMTMAARPEDHVIRHYAYMVDQSRDMVELWTEIWAARRLYIMSTTEFPSEDVPAAKSLALKKFLETLAKKVSEFYFKEIQREEMMFREEENFYQACKKANRKPVMRRESTFSVLALPDTFSASHLTDSTGYSYGKSRKQLYFDWLKEGCLRLIIDCNIDRMKNREYSRIKALQRIGEIRRVIEESLREQHWGLVVGIRRWASREGGFSSLGDAVLLKSEPQAEYKDSNIIRDRKAVEVFNTCFDRELADLMRDAGAKIESKEDMEKPESIKALADRTIERLNEIEEEVKNGALDAVGAGLDLSGG